MAQQTHDPLESLLQQADAAAGSPPALPGDLPRRLRGLARSEKRVRLGIGAVAVTAVIAVGLAWLFSANVGTGPREYDQPRIADSTGVSPRVFVQPLRVGASRVESETAIWDSLNSLGLEHQNLYVEKSPEEGLSYAIVRGPSSELSQPELGENFERMFQNFEIVSFQLQKGNLQFILLASGKYSLGS